MLTPLIFILITLVLPFSFAAPCPGCLNGENCTSVSDCLTTVADYVCDNNVCKEIYLNSTVCPSDSCSDSANCTIFNHTFLCYCGEHQVSKDDDCINKLASAPTIILPFVVFACPILTLLLLYHCCPTLKPRKAKQAWANLSETERKQRDIVPSDFLPAGLKPISDGSIQLDDLSISNPVPTPSERPEFFPEPRTEMPGWVPKCFHYRCCQWIAFSIPYSFFISLFMLLSDFFNMAITLAVWIRQRRPFLETNDYAYLIIELAAILVFFLECFVTRTMFHKFSSRNPGNYQVCFSPRYYKLWLSCFFFPNMCVLAPHVGLLKVWYCVGDSGYSLYYFITSFEPTPAIIGKVLSLAIRVPMAIAQIFMLIMSIRKSWKLQHVVALSDEEWYQVFAQTMVKWSASIPNIANIFRAKMKHQRWIEQLDSSADTQT